MASTVTPATQRLGFKADLEFKASLGKVGNFLRQEEKELELHLSATALPRTWEILT